MAEERLPDSESPKGNLLTSDVFEIFGNMRPVSLKMTSNMTSYSFQRLKIEIILKQSKIRTCN